MLHLFYSIIFLFLFFLSPCVVYAADFDIIINEIAAAEKSDHEWFELYNKGTATADITGWKIITDTASHKISAVRGDLLIDPGEYVVIAENAANTQNDYPNFTGTLLDSSWSSLVNDGMSIGIKNAKGDVIELFTYQPIKKYSLERKDPLKNEYSNENWQEHVNGNTIGIQNSNYTALQPLVTPTKSSSETSQDSGEVKQPSQNNEPLPSPLPKQKLYIPSRGDVVINELVSDPTDEEEEWVELYNTTQQEILLTGWTLEDGSKRKISLNGTLGTEDKKRFLVFEVENGMLNNAGEHLALRDSGEQVIDEVSYGNWNDGDITNNAPAPRDPFSLARAGDGVNTFNNKNDLKVTITPTRGISNSITEEQKEVEQKIEEKIIISEVLPNPHDKDISNEFIELRNIGKDSIELNNWELEVSNKRRFIIQQGQGVKTVLVPGQYVVFPRLVTGLPLRNKGGDTVKLFKPQKTSSIANLSYRDAAEAGQSYAVDARGRYHWTLQPTPGLSNAIVQENKEPNIVLDAPTQGNVGQELSFDASDTHDPDNDQLVFLWNFGDGSDQTGISPKHVYTKDGLYVISLRVWDGYRWVKQTANIKIKKFLEQQENKKESKVTIQENQQIKNSNVVLASSQIIPEIKIENQEDYNTTLLLNEIFPNPKGSDTGEFIELYNDSKSPVDMEQYAIRIEALKKDIVLPKLILEPKEFFLLTRAEFSFTLRNTKNTIFLVRQGKIIDSIDYEDAPSGLSLSCDSDAVWIWTNRQTPGQENDIPQFKDEDDTSSTSDYIPVARKLAQTKKSKKEITVKGIISVEQGKLGSSVFYLADPPLAVYASKIKSRLSPGDVVELTGKLSTRNNSDRLTISRQEDIKVIEHKSVPPPSEISLGEVSEENGNSLIKVKGEVSEIRWPYLTLAEGEDELQVSLRATDMKKKDVFVGDTFSIAGIVTSSVRGMRISPTSSTDVVLVNRKPFEKDQFEYIPENANEKQQFMQYLAITLITLLVIGAGYFIKKKYSL